MMQFACEFERIETGKVQCKRCERIVETKSPPDQVYSQCRSSKSVGLGDTIAKFTRITKLDYVAKFAMFAIGRGKSGCGCGGRQKRLNKKFAYKNRRKSS